MTTKLSESMFDDSARLHKYPIRWAAVAGTYPIDMEAIDKRTITKAVFQVSSNTDTGTINIHFEIDNGAGYTDVEFSGGDEILLATSTAQTETADSANEINANGKLQMILDTPVNSPTLVSVDLFYRTNTV